MNRSLSLGLSLFALAGILASPSASAQFPVGETPSVPEAVDTVEVVDSAEVAAPAAPEPVAPATRPRLIDSIPSSSDLEAQKPTVSELRQARAQYQARQRMERMERNRWAGYEPLRPNWNAVPMMSSRYPSTHRIYLPVYVYPW